MVKMKTIIKLSALLMLFIAGTSCNDDFLEKNNVDLYTLIDTLKLNSNQKDVETSLQIPENINCAYSVFMQPKWMSFSSMHGKVTNGHLPLSFSIVGENIPTWYPESYNTYYATIMLKVEDLGFISFIVAYLDLGSPTLQSSISTLNFESSGFREFTITNTTDGILNWEISTVPEWLNFSSLSGTLEYGKSTTITVSLNAEKIPAGEDVSGSFQIISNSVNGNITIPVHVSPAAIIPSEISKLNGIVTDAEYSHDSGIMAICTSNPNSLIIFNTNNNETNTIPLDKTPGCVSISEDGHKAVIGCTVSSVLYIDIDNLEIIADLSVDCIPYDIVLGNNSWCYITPSTGQWAYLRNLDLNTGELIAGTNSWLVYEKTIIRKVNAKPYMVGTRPHLSPTGILIFDISKGKASDTISYYHEDVGNCWISVDGTRLYARTKKVYSVPGYDYDYHPFPPPVYGQIETGFYNISGLDECRAINSIFIFSSYFDYPAAMATLIQQFNTTNLNLIRSINVSPVLVDENGIKTLFQAEPRYIFVNRDGTALYAIKNLKENYNKDYWTIESFRLD